MGAKWKVTPMELGFVYLPYHSLIFDETADAEKNNSWYDVPVLAFLLTNTETGEKRLIDAGGDSDHPELLANYDRVTGHGGYSAAEALKANGTDPDDITVIYATHLHWDHGWGMRYFPKARIIVQKKEVEFGCKSLYRAPNCTLYPEEPLPYFLKFYHQMELIDGDRDFGDGIKAFLTPGHSDGSMSFLVDTPEGWCCFVGDAMYIKACWDKGRPAGALTDVRLGFEGYKRIKSEMDAHQAKFVASHDYQSLELFADKIIMNEVPEKLFRG
ncbi:MAG: N-acyl homoserine lactonase family protein [Lachnospiraceae bacterium]|nr:N-acyl homoserine lactonase family protein [Lachnospiraceae bacterium]